MKVLTKIVRSASVEFHERPGITVVALQSCTRLLSASAFVLNEEDALSTDVMNCVDSWRIPLFVVLNSASVRGSSSFISVQATLLQAPLSEDHFALIQEAAMTYEMATLPPFTRAITEFTLKERPTFACPGHQGGKCLDFHPAGLRLKQLLGEKIFKVDVPHASPELGDVLNHEGPIRQAEGLAAKVFNSDETYFVLNGTSTANKIVTSALLSYGDLVLMDRNNHKSIFLGALVQGGACPVYLDNFRDDYGVLGGYKKGALEEDHLRLKASRIDEAKSREIRPFRLAIVQHATCDGVVVDAAALLNKIGHLCDYVLFDSAWLGYEPFIESLSWRSPLHLSYQEDAPGIIVTQSVHKQMSGLSQTSQIHKKDNHVRHQTRFCSSHVFNSAFMLHSSTSPFYPLFMSLEVNAAVHANGNGKLLWSEAVERAIEFREQVTACCRVIKPYYGSREPLTEIEAGIISSVYTQSYLPAHQYTALPGLSPIEIDFHYLDPCKVIFTTRRHGDIDCGSCIAIPAAIVTHFLRENNFTPEKCDFYNFTILVSPSSEAAELARLSRLLGRLEQFVLDETSLLEVLPSLAESQSRFANLTLYELCESINNLYSACRVEQLQSEIFSSVCSLDIACTPFDANQAFVRGAYALVDIEYALGRVAAEGVIPYPPGVMCIAPGERWNDTLIAYLSAIELLMNTYPEFAPHIQGVYQTNRGGSISLGVLVLDLSDLV